MKRKTEKKTKEERELEVFIKRIGIVIARAQKMAEHNQKAEDELYGRVRREVNIQSSE